MIEIVEYTRSRIDDVVAFERELRVQESVWGWEIDDEYVSRVTESFEDQRFGHCISFLAYDQDKVVGRIDVSLITSRFEGFVNGYLDWICVLKSHRHRGVARQLMEGAKQRLREQGAVNLIAIVAQNEEALSFYRAIPDATIRDQGIWITL